MEDNEMPLGMFPNDMEGMLGFVAAMSRGLVKTCRLWVLQLIHPNLISLDWF